MRALEELSGSLLQMQAKKGSVVVEKSEARRKDPLASTQTKRSS